MVRRIGDSGYGNRSYNAPSVDVYVNVNYVRKRVHMNALEQQLHYPLEAALPGKVARVELVSDPVTEERIAEVAFAAPPAGLSIGELVEVTLNLPAAANSPILPNAAIRRLGEQTGVWLVEGENSKQRLRFAPIKTGVSGLDGRVQVLDGVASGAMVVVYSERDLTADSRFKVVDSLSGKRQ